MLITINAALFLIVQEVIFLPQNCPSLRSGRFGGQKSLDPLEKPREIADYVMKST
jgi:hypothetical protein